MGGHRRDLRAPGLRRRRDRLAAGAVPDARRQLRRRQRRRQDLRDDRLAGRLDDRPEGRGQGRDQPAVARHVERRQRLPAGRDRRRLRRPGRRRGDEGRRSTGAGRRSCRCSTRSTAWSARSRRARSTSTRPSRGCSAASVDGVTPADLGRAGRADPGEGRGGGRARARRSARRATCGSPTRWATTTWSRASPGSRSSSPEGGAPSRTSEACPRRTCTCTSPGRCGTRPCSSWPTRDGIHLPDALVEDWPPELSAADEKGWFRFQRLYDVARSVLRTEDDVRRLVREAAEDDVARRRPVAGDPGRPERLRRPVRRDHRVHRPGPRRGAPRPPATPGIGMAVVIAANRTRHPLDARTLARLAAQYAGRGVVGFGLSNDERRGTHRATSRRPSGSPSGPGCCSIPHGGELLGPESVRLCLDELHADRLGHGVRVGRGPRPARPGRRRPGSRSRCARPPTWRWASTPT